MTKLTLTATNLQSERPPAGIQSDVVNGIIITAAIVLFVWTGGTAIPASVRQLTGRGEVGDQGLTANFLLNVALLFLAWRRYKDAKAERVRLAEEQDHARKLSLIDPLTGLGNRRALSELGDALIATARRRNKAVAMMLLDLDHFKNVNDVHGHSVGDALLRAVSAEMIRLSPESAICARLGGDEFACAILYDPNNAETVTNVASALIGRVAQPFDAAGIHTHISGTIGLAATSTDCETIDGLMRRADIAMYSAKHQGRNRFAWFDVSMENELRQRNETELGLRKGIPLGEFVPFFEPQIDLQSNTIIGFEMLARWNHPSGALIGPDSFIQVAEETGMIGDLSLSVMRQAFEEAKSWDPSITISVNISPVQLRDPWLAQKIVKLLVETGFPPSRLEVEITESSLFENLALAQSTVGSLKNQGIKLALDDFGTGYSSLAHLRALPFDRIKIDKSFVLSLLSNKDSAAIVNAITRLGDSLNLPVTAEGVEDPEIYEKLRTLGCQKGQGWHLGRPADIKRTRLLLDRSGLLEAKASPAAAEQARVAEPLAEEPARMLKAG